jgi:AcrR family transcriptional regulator
MPSTPTRTYDASGRQAAAEERRRRVVDVAHTLFLDIGYGSTSIATIAEAAGVSAPFVYATFGSKAGILGAVAGVAVAGDHEDVLVRDRADAVEVRASSDAEEWIRLGALYTRRSNERSAAIMHLISSVAGSDPAVAELLDQLLAGRRSDLALTVTLRPGMREDVGVQDLVDTVDVLTHWETWWTLVEVAGWSPERYEAWLADVMRGYLLA